MSAFTFNRRTLHRVLVVVAALSFGLGVAAVPAGASTPPYWAATSPYTPAVVANPVYQSATREATYHVGTYWWQGNEWGTAGGGVNQKSRLSVTGAKTHAWSAEWHSPKDSTTYEAWGFPDAEVRTYLTPTSTTPTPLADFTALSSSFKMTLPTASLAYHAEAAYTMSLTRTTGEGQRYVMIWTQTHNAGIQTQTLEAANVKLGSSYFNIYDTGDGSEGPATPGGNIILKPVTHTTGTVVTETTGTLHLLGILKALEKPIDGKAWLTADTSISWVQDGVELRDSYGKKMNVRETSFYVTAKR